MFLMVSDLLFFDAPPFQFCAIAVMGRFNDNMSDVVVYVLTMFQFLYSDFCQNDPGLYNI